MRDANGIGKNVRSGDLLPKVGESFTFKTFTRTVEEYRVDFSEKYGWQTWVVYKPHNATNRRRMLTDKWIWWTENNGPRLSGPEAVVRKPKKSKVVLQPLVISPAPKPDSDTRAQRYVDLEKKLAAAQLRESNLRGALDIAIDTLRENQPPEETAA